MFEIVDRRTDHRKTGILLAHTCALGSDEVKINFSKNSHLNALGSKFDLDFK